MCMCVCVCKGKYLYVHVCMRACVRACVRVCVGAHARFEPFFHHRFPSSLFCLQNPGHSGPSHHLPAAVPADILSLDALLQCQCRGENEGVSPLAILFERSNCVARLTKIIGLVN